MSEPEEPKRKPSVLIPFSALGIAFVLSCLLAFFFQRSPTPDPQAGLVVEMPNRFGSPYYASRTFEILFDAIQWALGGTFLIWAWCNRRNLTPKRITHSTLLGGQKHVWKTDEELEREE